MNYDLIILAILIFTAGFVDSISGGGGILSIPAYLNYGIKIEELLGTNKLSSTIGTFTAIIKYLRNLKFKYSYLFFIFTSAAFSSSLGAYFISSVPSKLIKYLILVLIPLISFTLLLKKDFGKTDLSYKISPSILTIKSIIISSVIGFYDGIMGPGTGVFLVMSYTKFCKYNLLKATALTKFTNFSSNIAALITFLIIGRVNIKIGLLMALISVAGNYTGAHMVIKKGEKIIKPLIITVANLILIKTLLGLTH